MRFSPTWRLYPACLTFVAILLVSTWRLDAQVMPFEVGAIPMVDGKIVFHVDFLTDMGKAEARSTAGSYLMEALTPHIGKVYENNDNHTRCRMTDYISISKSWLQSVGMYMTYDLSLQYRDGGCTLVIWNIVYIEKRYYEAQEATKRKLAIPEYPAEDIMLGNKYKLMLIKNASARVTAASIDRINEIVEDLDGLFSPKN